QLFIIARNGATFRSRWGKSAHAEVEANDPDTPDLVRRRDLASGSLALNDTGDEIVLLNPAAELVDAVAFNKGDYTALGLTGLLQPPKGYSLQRVPGAQFPDVAEVRHRFLFAPPRPFEARGLPLAQSHNRPPLDENLVAVWGSLGAQSNFSSGLTAPPHYLLAAAAAQGLDFVAIADPGPTTPWRTPETVIPIPAWHWQGKKGERAILYTAADESLSDHAALLDYVLTAGSLAQWQGKDLANTAGFAAVAADTINAADNLAALYKLWASSNQPLLPAGNSNPPLPGAVEPTPHYTGLAVASADLAALQEAMALRRGWLTNAPGLWLTLAAEMPNGEHTWMGSTIQPANEVTFHLHYGDQSGQLAGLALWQDGRPIRQLDLPTADGRWSLTLPAAPGSFFYAVATQADGDFAVTAPVLVSAETSGSVLINEVLPAPAADHNGDGLIDGEDEFIELYNPGTQPVSLAGWLLSDNRADLDTGKRFTFPAGRYLSGGERLLLWRKETWINLNIENDFVRLIRADGGEADRIGWAAKPPRARSLSRYPDGGAWIDDASVTPGRPNARGEQFAEQEAVASRWPASASSVRWNSPNENTGSRSLRQAGWVANAKLYGLDVFVEFYGVVTLPPGLIDHVIYVADPAAFPFGPFAGAGIQVYLRKGEFPTLHEGDQVRIRGWLNSHRGELELTADQPDKITLIATGAPLLPLSMHGSQLGEQLEGRLVTLRGVVVGWQGDSILLADPTHPEAEPVRVVVRSSLGWQRPYVQKGDVWQATGIVSQLAKEAPWNGGYRVLVRHEDDLVRISRTNRW
ncbi:MAG TPA: lamin tail domain-containing protein, partial [Caldilineaceae bacterium]|nr:lamin tail domain-containing protein [Caldilineaceae bacterium]